MSESDQALIESRREQLANCKAEILRLTRQTLTSAHKLGVVLTEVRDNNLWENDDTTAADFYEWAREEFGYSDSAARNFIMLAAKYTEDQLASSHRLQLTSVLEVEKTVRQLPEGKRDEARQAALDKLSQPAPAQPPKASADEARKAAQDAVDEVGEVVGSKGKREQIDVTPVDKPPVIIPPTAGEVVAIDAAMPVNFEPAIWDPSKGKVVKRMPRSSDGSVNLDGLHITIDMPESGKMLIVEVGKKLRGWVADS